MNNHVSSAKKWMARGARATAITVLPLAVAIVAHAGVILPTTSPVPGGCYVSGGGAVEPICTLAQLAVDPSGSQGVGFSLTNYAPGDTYLNITGQVFGGISGSLPSGAIPYSFSFTGTPLNGSFFYVSADNLSTQVTDFHIVAGGSTGAGSGVLNLGPGNLQNGHQIRLTFGLDIGNFEDSIGNDAPEVSVESLSVQFFPVADSPVPEPGTLMLMSGALGALGFLMRRKSNSQL